MVETGYFERFAVESGAISVSGPLNRSTSKTREKPRIKSAVKSHKASIRSRNGKARQKIPSFRDAAKIVHEEHKASWKNGKHQSQWLTTLETYAFPKLGNRLVSDIRAPEIRDVRAPIWLTKPETARRVRQRIGTVLDWACVKGFRETEAPLRSLSKGLPRQPRKDRHFAAMNYAEVPAFMKRLQQRVDWPSGA